MAKMFNKQRYRSSARRYFNNLDSFLTNEPARHKLLDIVGRSYLVGYPIKANIIAYRPVIKPILHLQKNKRVYQEK
ncbi:MAG: UDP-3-O-acyl-N-acetylglucosamine deacetylase [Bacteroidetes bacterium]|nr:UDP-3-O-acyl-N-acetylglucosamine deacetylase [Bacteroidota bacterium]